MNDRLNELRAEVNIHGVLDIDQAEELFGMLERSEKAREELRLQRNNYRVQTKELKCIETNLLYELRQGASDRHVRLIKGLTRQINDLRSTVNSYRVEKARAESAARRAADPAAAAQHLAEALRLTVEYVGTATLPALPGWSWYDALAEHYPSMAEELSKPQYRGMPFHRFPKPATTEAELDGLPPFTMILDNEGDRLVKLQNGRWRVIANETWIPYRANEIALPATILHTPEGNK